MHGGVTREWAAPAVEPVVFSGAGGVLLDGVVIRPRGGGARGVGGGVGACVCGPADCGCRGPCAESAACFIHYVMMTTFDPRMPQVPRCCTATPTRACWSCCTTTPRGSACTTSGGSRLSHTTTGAVRRGSGGSGGCPAPCALGVVCGVRVSDFDAPLMSRVYCVCVCVCVCVGEGSSTGEVVQQFGL